ncbi:TPA: DsbA family protein [Burkholderia cenocepacia]|uniref:DsbA family protein n=1 Tax=Pseudomonadota TaxID=1224 RepID=UPI0003BB4A4B|nr:MULTISPECIES: thioredoxin domain-containing protein [Pseudomonadota]ERY96098.1 hypothetical protein Q022_04382 [Pseudomonas aeruginosa BWHPSA009]
MHKLRTFPTVHHLWIGLVVAVFFGVGGGLLLHRITHGSPRSPASGDSSSSSSGPPWIYGRANARFTVIEYGDLECPYCRAYFPVLRHWIDAHPDINWQWRHLPLAMHDPAATAEARIAECAGEVGGSAAFWKAVAWIYTHTRSDGQGLPPGMPYPDLTPAMQRCLNSDRPDTAIRAQSADAINIGIKGTPTLRVRDRRSGRTLLIPGPAEGDALLSAIDWLALDGQSTAGSPSTEMPADAVGDMPR